jgi:hypothetical protein
MMHRGFWSRFALVAGTICLVLGGVMGVARRNFFRAESFADRASESLSDPRVAAFVADRITNVVIQQSPDLIGARPIILATAQGLITSAPFRALVRVGARKVHEALFSKEGQSIVLSIPDLEVLMRSALGKASPEIAAKIPGQLETALGSLSQNQGLRSVTDIWRLGIRMRRWALFLFLVLGPGLLTLSLWIAPDRQRALLRTGIALFIGAVVMAVGLPVGRLLFATTVHDPLLRGALQGLWRTYLGPLFGWSLFYGGLGVLFAAAGSSLMGTLVLTDIRNAVLRVCLSPPRLRRWRTIWGISLVIVGVATVLYPQEILMAAVILTGVVFAFIGVRTLFQLVLETAPAMPVFAKAESRGMGWLRPVLIALLVVVIGGVWVLLRNPERAPATSEIVAINGYPELCDRRVDQVCFAGAHNAMSNADIPDWMFPHHEHGIPKMLEDGIRSLAIDVHYGFAGGARIKTDLDTEQSSREKIETAIGKEGVDAALRIRERLVGVDEGHHKMYFCHGYCELGAYEVVPTLREIHEFMVQHPDEVLLIIVEDYVSPEDLAGAFKESGLEDMVYTGTMAPWPTLRELVTMGQRVIVFIESGKPGVPWLRPTLGNIQETPYSFHSPEEFSCRPNRGGTEGSLFLINHWIETTPRPLPSNAAIVNSYDFLLKRVQQCAKERKHLPNIISVDFYRTGDLLRVVDTMNGVAAPMVAEKK